MLHAWPQLASAPLTSARLRAQELCCCARRHATRASGHCPAQYHCYKKCPMSRAGKAKGGDADGVAAGPDVTAQREEMMHGQATAAAAGVRAALQQAHTSVPSGYVAPPAPPPLHLWPGNVAVGANCTAHPPPPPPAPLQPRATRGAVIKQQRQRPEACRRPLATARPPGGNIAPAPPSPMNEATRMTTSKPEDMRAALFNAVELELERMEGRSEGKQVLAPRAARKRTRAAGPAGGDGGARGEGRGKGGETEGVGEGARKAGGDGSPPRVRRRHQDDSAVAAAEGAALDTPAPSTATLPARPQPLDPVLKAPAVPVLAEAARRVDSSIAAHREAVERGTPLVVGGVVLGPGVREEAEAEPSSRWETATELGAPASSQPRPSIRLRTRHEQAQQRADAGGPWTGFELLPHSLRRADPHSAASTFARRYGCCTPGALHLAIARHVMHRRASVGTGVGAGEEEAQATGGLRIPVPKPCCPVPAWGPLGELPAAKALRCGSGKAPPRGPASATATPAVTALPSSATARCANRSSSGTASEGRAGPSAEAAFDGAPTASQGLPKQPAFAQAPPPPVKLAAGPAPAAGHAPAWVRRHGLGLAAMGRDPYAAQLMQFPVMGAPHAEGEGGMPRSAAQPFPPQGMWGPMPFYPMHQASWPSMPHDGFPHA